MFFILPGVSNIFLLNYSKQSPSLLKYVRSHLLCIWNIIFPPRLNLPEVHIRFPHDAQKRDLKPGPSDKTKQKITEKFLCKIYAAFFFFKICLQMLHPFVLKIVSKLLYKLRWSSSHQCLTHILPYKQTCTAH